MVLPVPGLDKPEWEVSPVLGVAAGDLDHDGKDDILCSGDTGMLVLFRGRGDGTVEGPRLLPSPVPSRPLALLLEDLDLDGSLDLLAGYRGDTYVFWGQTEGHVDFSRPTVIDIRDPLRFDVVRPIHRTFIRGDADDDGKVDAADARAIVEQLFRLREVACGDAMDVDDSGRVNVTDAVRLLLHLFSGGPPPPYPYPIPGGDPTKDAAKAMPRQIAGDLGCSPETFRFDDFSPCPSNAPPGFVCKNPIRQFLDVSVPEK